MRNKNFTHVLPGKNFNEVEQIMGSNGWSLCHYGIAGGGHKAIYTNNQRVIGNNIEVYINANGIVEYTI